MRPPPNAPPDPLGTARPGNRSCAENRDCKPGDACFAPDFTPPAAAPRCQQDTQCPSGQVCSGTTCASPCTPTSCGPGQECRAGGQCAPIAFTDARAAHHLNNFGTSVALTRDTFVVGAPLEDSNATAIDGDQANNLAPDAGAVYVFR
jgi:Cys-rich repeat protein